MRQLALSTVDGAIVASGRDATSASALEYVLTMATTQIDRVSVTQAQVKVS